MLIDISSSSSIDIYLLSFSAIKTKFLRLRPKPGLSKWVLKT